MPYRSINSCKSEEHSRLQFPKFQISWSDKLAPGTSFSSIRHRAVRPTWGTEVYFADLGSNLIIVAREKSGQIRALNYKNSDMPYNQNSWTIESEFPANKAQEFFNAAQRQFAKVESKNKLISNSRKIAEAFKIRLKKVA